MDLLSEVSKNLIREIEIYIQRIILLNYQNNYVGRSNWLLEYQNCCSIAYISLEFFYMIILMIQYNYFHRFVSNFLDISTKSSFYVFFLCMK